MDNFLNGLENYGLDGLDMSNLFDDEPKLKKVKVEAHKVAKPVELTEEDYLFDKTVECVVCGKQFKTKAVKASKAKRIGADEDLRPKYKDIDTLKYDVCSCPYCGYTAMTKYFAGISTAQIKLVKEAVCSKFRPTIVELPKKIDYDLAIERYKLALYNTVVKRGKVSERAYCCLKLSWLFRGKVEEMLSEGFSTNDQLIIHAKQEEKNLYNQAYEGLLKAVASESFPMCGMDSYTMDYLLAQMSFSLGKYDVSSKLVGRLLTSNANKNIKDKALELKQKIIDMIKANA